MYYQITCAAVRGMDVQRIEVQADISDGLPSFEMVGLPGSEVRESRERVRTALRNSGIRLPSKRITVNFSPADLKKEGTAFDLPIAAAILGGIRAISQETDDCIFMGELGLDGTVLPVRGCISVAKAAEGAGYRRILLPAANAAQCRRISGLTCIGVATLQEMIDYLRNGTVPEQKEELQEESIEEKVMDFSELGGMEIAKRAAVIAAAGRHHLLIMGPPGAGKTMLASCIRGILPEPEEEERKIQMELASLAGSEDSRGERPFRKPDAGITAAALMGGGKGILPGELALAHQGILLLDELPSYTASVLRLLRGPMEEGKIALTRSGKVYEFPADFQLIATMNPCPCGYFPDMQRCTCTPDQRIRYRRNVDGPLMDRMDLFLSMQPMDYEDLTGKRGKGESSSVIRERIKKVWEIQRMRYREEPFSFNARLTSQKIPEYCALEPEEEELLKRTFVRFHLSARGYHKVLKTARTIADLEGSPRIRSAHLKEAIFYRAEDAVREGRRR